MDNIPVPSFFADYGSRRGSNTSLANSTTPPRSPIPIFFKPPSSPGGYSIISNGSNENSGGTSGRRFFASSPRKQVCTMDCANCRKMALRIREETASPLDYASAPCSRKSSGGLGKLSLFISRGFNTLIATNLMMTPICSYLATNNIKSKKAALEGVPLSQTVLK